MDTPDKHSHGFLTEAPDPLRYEYQSGDPDDSGMKLARLMHPNARVIDVGCGTGSVTMLLKQEAKVDITGVEPDRDRAERAKARGLQIFNGFLTADFLKEQGPFDYVVFADVLEHLPDPAQVVLLAKQGLKPGGSVLVSVPNVAHWFVRTALVRGRFDYADCGIMDATHLRWFTRKTICEFFENLGFRIDSVDTTIMMGLREYHKQRPWRWLKEHRRHQVVRALNKRFPALFGCQ